MDCWLDPHWRSTVTPGTVSGQPAVSTAVRAMSRACSPACETHPQITSSTIPGSMPALCASALSTCADRSAACTPDRPPLRLPTGERTASTMTASAMAYLLLPLGSASIVEQPVSCAAAGVLTGPVASVDMSRIVIVGGHGKVALHLARILNDRGDEVISIFRNPDHTDDVTATGARPVVADIENLDTPALADLLVGHDAVVFSAGAGGGDPARTYAVDRD